jgi:hypothetical protein
MSLYQTNVPTEINGRKSLIFDGKNNIEFDFHWVKKCEEYDDIVIQIHNQEYNQVYGKLNNPLFIRDNAIYSYYKTSDNEYIKIVDAIASVVASAYNMKVVTTLGEVK